MNWNAVYMQLSGLALLIVKNEFLCLLKGFNDIFHTILVSFFVHLSAFMLIRSIVGLHS